MLITLSYHDSVAFPSPMTVFVAYWVCVAGHQTDRQTVKWLSHVQLFATPWTVDYQAPPSMGFSRREKWSGLTFPSPENSYRR